MNLSTSVLRTRDELKGAIPSWYTLLEHCSAPTPFLSPEWIMTWLDVVAPDASILTITVYDGTRLIGVAPFYIGGIKIANTMTFPCLRVLGDRESSSEYLDIVVDPDREDEVISVMARTLSAELPASSFVWIPYADVGGGAAARLQRLLGGAFRHPASREFSYYRVPLPCSCADYVKALGSRQRNNLRRYTKRLQSKGVLTLTNLVDTHDTAGILEILYSLHGERWRAQGEQGAFERKPAFARFIEAYTEVARRESVAALCLWLNDEPVAIRFGYINGETMYEIQAGFRPAYNGSGIVAMHRAIEYCIERGLAAYDFLAYAGEYKMRMGAEARPGRSLFASPKTIAGVLVARAGIWPTGRFIELI